MASLTASVLAALAPTALTRVEAESSKPADDDVVDAALLEFLGSVDDDVPLDDEVPTSETPEAPERKAPQRPQGATDE